MIKENRYDTWPALPLPDWRETESAVHMVSQIMGKLRLALAPHESHWTHVPLAVTVNGLSTGALGTPTGRSVDVDLDLPAGRMTVSDSKGDMVVFPISGHSVAEVYANVVHALADFGVQVELNVRPQEVPDPVPFPEQTSAVTYDHDSAARFHRALLSVGSVLAEDRGQFEGPCGPVGLYWGSFDLAYHRFSGRPASPPPRAGVIGAEAMNAEYYCCGFWPGDARYPRPGFFAYTYPKPEDLAEFPVEPAEAGWNNKLGEFILPYDAVRIADQPAEALRSFTESTYRAGATLGDWPRW